MSPHCAEPTLFLFVCVCVFVCGFCAFLANGWTAIKQKPVWQTTSKEEYVSEIYNKVGEKAERWSHKAHEPTEQAHSYFVRLFQTYNQATQTQPRPLQTATFNRRGEESHTDN